MSDYIYHIGNDYDCINKEYVILSTDKGQQITVALAESGVPFKGRYDEESMTGCREKVMPEGEKRHMA